MNYNIFNPLAMGNAYGSNNFWSFIFLVAIWELVWKGLALWRAGRLNQGIWFVIILIFNTLGLLPIIYLLITQKDWQNRRK